MSVLLRDRLKSAGRHARENRCLFLMVGLLVALAIGPWLDGIGARVFLYALSISGFASAIYAVGGGRRYAVALLLLGAATLAFGMLAETTSSTGWAIPALGFFIVFGGFTLVRVLSYVVRHGVITVDKIYGALSVYLLAGFTWGGVYALTEQLNPGSFQWAYAPEQHAKTLLQTFVYMSFVTLASLGYGDITPVTPEARSLAMLEVIFGTFYIVIIIARLVAGLGIGSQPPSTGGLQ